MDEILPEVQARSDEAREHLDRLQTEFDSRLEEVGSQMKQTAEDVVEQVTSEQTNLLDSLDQQVSGFCSGLTTVGETANATGESMVAVKDTMAAGMNTTSLGLKSIIGTLLDIRQILEKIC